MPGSSSLGSASSIQAAVRQLEAEADAIIQMVREGQRGRRLQQGPPPTVSSASAAVVAGSSVAAPHPPAGAAATPATVATVSMSCTHGRHYTLLSHCMYFFNNMLPNLTPVTWFLHFGNFKSTVSFVMHVTVSQWILPPATLLLQHEEGFVSELYCLSTSLFYCWHGLDCMLHCFCELMASCLFGYYFFLSLSDSIFDLVSVVWSTVDVGSSTNTERWFSNGRGPAISARARFNTSGYDLFMTLYFV